MKTQKKEYQYRPQGWQLEPEQVTTTMVQFWSDGVMVTLITQAAARERVTEGTAFVITDQAIGLMVNGISKA